ncbi:MAG: hypothetical protein U1B83_06010, partial [Candidatus Cloacimonadaceae bacterium]|nr:hypothetical protein [Candidatus Cloacimonadaceae bacterium]
DLTGQVTSDQSYEQLYKTVYARVSSLLGTRDYATDITNQYLLKKAGHNMAQTAEQLERDTHGAIESYFEELRRYSYSLALRHTGRPDLADEIAQDAIIELLKSNTPKRFIKGWLHKVTLNLIVQNIRIDSQYEQLVSELIREEQVTRQILENDLPDLDVISPPNAQKFLCAKDLRQYKQMKLYKDLKHYAAATKNSYATAREQSVRIRHNFKAAYLKAKGWESSPQILSYPRYKAIRRFLAKLVTLCKPNAKIRQRETNHTGLLAKYSDVFQGVQNLYDWGITPLDESHYRVFLYDNADGINSIMVSMVIFITKAHRILIRTCNRLQLAVALPLNKDETPQVEKGKMILGTQQIRSIIAS